MLYGVFFLLLILLQKLLEWYRLSTNIHKQFDLSVKPKDEKDIKLVKIFLYPIRGIKGIEVESAELSNSGFIKDRNWVIVSIKRNKSIATSGNYKVTYLRLQIDSKSETELEITL